MRIAEEVGDGGPGQETKAKVDKEDEVESQVEERHGHHPGSFSVRV